MLNQPSTGIIKTLFTLLHTDIAHYNIDHSQNCKTSLRHTDRQAQTKIMRGNPQKCRKKSSQHSFLLIICLLIIK